tara:strand:+ start:42 stop:476 length:435 start_codon:yes stop_codon:yes gene_type:complete
MKTEQQTMTSPKMISLYSDKVLLSRLKLEIKGMTPSGTTAYARIKKQFGLKGNKRKVYQKLKEILDQTEDDLLNKKEVLARDLKVGDLAIFNGIIPEKILEIHPYGNSFHSLIFVTDQTDSRNGQPWQVVKLDKITTITENQTK